MLLLHNVNTDLTKSCRLYLLQDEAVQQFQFSVSNNVTVRQAEGNKLGISKNGWRQSYVEYTTNSPPTGTEASKVQDDIYT